MLCVDGCCCLLMFIVYCVLSVFVGCVVACCSFVIWPYVLFIVRCLLIGLVSLYIDV